MKKIFLIIAIVIASFTSCSVNSNSTNIGDLVTLQKQYENELSVLNKTLEYRAFKAGGSDEHSNIYATYEEFQRMKVLEDSIDILDIEIERYKYTK